MKVKVLPFDVTFEANSNQSLLEQCLEQGVVLKSVCKGVPSCAECRIRIVEGQNNVLPPQAAEIALIGSNYYIDGRRLACQCRVFGPLTIDASEHVKTGTEINKKVRGIPQDKLKTSHAVMSTLVLDQNSKSGSEGSK